MQNRLPAKTADSFIPQVQRPTIFTASSFCSSIYIDQEFVDQSAVPWQRIPTPAFQQILNAQR